MTDMACWRRRYARGVCVGGGSQAIAWLPMACNASATGLPCALTADAVGKPLPAFHFQLTETGPRLILPLAALLVDNATYGLSDSAIGPSFAGAATCPPRSC